MSQRIAIGLKGSASFGTTVLFSGLHLDLKPGWTCLLGASGVGKTTILRLLAGLPTGARFDGLVHRPARLAYMAQDDLLQDRFSVLNNVLLGQRLRGEKPDALRASLLLRAVGLAGTEKRRPQSLSGGQRQRVALARALMEETQVALLDEPFSSLDGTNRAKMQDLAFTCLQGRQVLLVTHDPVEALRLGSQLKLLKDGKLVDLPALSGPAPHSTDSRQFAKAYHAIMSKAAGIT